MPLNENQNTCHGKSRRTGKPCGQPAVTGSNFCRLHGGGALGNRSRTGMPKPPGSGAPPPKGNMNGWKHGAYSSRLPPAEQDRYEKIRASYDELFENANAIDNDCIHRLAMFQTKLEAAIENGAPGDAIEALQRMIHRELKALQATRESKDNGKSTGTSPAEVIAALLSQARGRAALPPAKAEVIDVEADDVSRGGSEDA
jgi:hypothetical protein